jgi:ribonucleoside-diphosphate reductase alpha chain
MLKNIVKRDGSTEPFTPHKLNKWGQWAAESLGQRVDWSSVVLDAVRGAPDTLHSQELQNKLINSCLLKKDWPHNLMAGRLYAVKLYKDLYDDLIPSLYALHKHLAELGLMRKMSYSEEEYGVIECLLDHQRDLTYAHYQIHHIVSKYSIQDRKAKARYETPQFVFMRMAMALAEDEPNGQRIPAIKAWYESFSKSRVNAPTPNYVNLGTPHAGYASCCLYTVEDSAASLAVGDHIAYTMTYMSSGIGSHLNVRSLNDPVRGGLIEHQGKLPYFKSLAGAVKANIQAGRGGACTTYYSVFDPEAESIALLQNPRTPRDRQNRDIHFCVQFNRLFAKKVAKGEDIFTFNVKSQPRLMELFFSGDQEAFEDEYERVAASEEGLNWVSARARFLLMAQQSYDVGTHYYMFVDEVNRHTPFKEPIYLSNLCTEIAEPTKPYKRMVDLYAEDHEDGEVALCNLAAINVAAINSEQEYADAMYYALKMIDKTIHQANYALPHIGYTAKQRMNAGVGVIGLAYYLAKRGLDYTSTEGLREIHRVAERHLYHAIKASLRLGKELGNAPWMHKTKWPEGWLPIDSYKKSVDEIVEPVYYYDWEALRAEVIENGGIRNSCLIAHMPTESSSKASSVPNSVYPIRDLYLKKTDRNTVISWCAPNCDLLGEKYQIAWDIPSVDLIKVYAVLQKFCDQSISADLYQDRRGDKVEVTTDQMITEFLAMVKYGMKTRYYQNSLVAAENNSVTDMNKAPVCVDGACML